LRASAAQESAVSAASDAPKTSRRQSAVSVFLSSVRWSGVSPDSSSRSAAVAALNVASTSASPRAVSSTSRARLSRGSARSSDVAQALEVSQHLVDGLLADTGAFGDDRRALSGRAGPLEHRPVVLDGSLDLLIGREWRVLRQGDHAAVPPGTVHAFPRRVRSRPGSQRAPTGARLRALVQRLCRTANERSVGDLRDLRSLLYLAMLVDEYPQHSRAAWRLLNATASHLAALARLLRLRPA
jgi:hypothetical protein